MLKKDYVFEQFIIEKLKLGDTDSFSHIFSTYYQSMVFFAYCYIHELPAAEDIVQDVFVKLWEDHERLNVTVSLKSMLLKAVQNKCIDRLRHKKVMNDHHTYIIDHSTLYEFDTDNYILGSELDERIGKAISNLPKEFKEAFEMNRFEGLKYHEIAAKLNVSVRTVEVRISRALALLRKSLFDFL